MKQSFRSTAERADWSHDVCQRTFRETVSF